MLHRLCEPPSIPLSFSLATILPRRGTSRFPYGREPIGEPPTQCPSFTSRTSLSPRAFLPISTHFTAPPEVPGPPTSLQTGRFGARSPVEPGDFSDRRPH